MRTDLLAVSEIKLDGVAAGSAALFGYEKAPRRYNERLPFIWRPCPHSAGTRLGPYEVVPRIGVGAMDEVYRAHEPSSVSFEVVEGLCELRELRPRFRG